MKPSHTPSQNLFGGLLAVLLSLCSFNAVHAQILISTYPSWNGSSNEFFWGVLPEGTPSYGQTFTAPSDNVLNNFTFSLLNNSSQAITYQPFVYAWNGTAITGSALFTGAISSVAISASYQNVTTNTGSLSLQTGQQYVAFLTTSTTSGSAVGIPWGLVPSDPYTGGTFVFDNNNAFSPIGGTWSDSNTGQDLAFSANFSPAVAPEPSTWAMLLGGVGTLAFWHTRTRHPQV